MIDRGARYKVYATIHTSQLSTPLRQEQRATRRFLEATPMKEVTFQRAHESARGAVYESLSGRYRPRNIARPTPKRAGGAGARSWWTIWRRQYVIACCHAEDRCPSRCRCAHRLTTAIRWAHRGCVRACAHPIGGGAPRTAEQREGPPTISAWFIAICVHRGFTAPLIQGRCWSEPATWALGSKV